MSKFISEVNIVDVIKEVVESMDISNIESIDNVRYTFGHIKDIITDTKKYVKKHQNFPPTIALFQDLEEIIVNNYVSVDDVHIMLFVNSKQEYSSNERYEKRYNPLLTLLNKSFINSLEKKVNIRDLKKIDRISWGTSTFGDSYVDAIELILDLNIYKFNFVFRIFFYIL